MNEYYQKYTGRVQKFLTLQKLLSERLPKVTFLPILQAIKARQQLAANLSLTQTFISR